MDGNELFKTAEESLAGMRRLLNRIERTIQHAPLWQVDEIINILDDEAERLSQQMALTEPKE